MRGDLVFTRKRSKGTRQERADAWQAQADIAVRAPFTLTAVPHPGRDEPDAGVGEAVADSEAVHAALSELAAGLDPSLPVSRFVQDALAAEAALLELRPSWVAYCDEAGGLDPAATDPQSEMSRLWVSADQVRAWPRFAEAKAALDAATGPIVSLQRELAEFCGTDIARTDAA
ncbi:hypothetical protein AB0F20_29725 [Streptomyces goshikiensis]|uniref:hypothetical protein n=1 Tax=Streptomyces goshikiensis TaxID=1942 RepID=UPI00340D3329